MSLKPLSWPVPECLFIKFASIQPATLRDFRTDLHNYLKILTMLSHIKKSLNISFHSSLQEDISHRKFFKVCLTILQHYE